MPCGSVRPSSATSCSTTATAFRGRTCTTFRLPIVRSGSSMDVYVQIRTTALGQLAHSKHVVHIPDLMDGVAYREREPLRVISVEQAGARSFVGVPMLKDDKLVGAIVIYRQEVRPFTEKQIELVKILPRKPSSPSRIRVCSTSCANHSSSKRRQPTCSRSSADRRSTCRRCSNSLVELAARVCEADTGIIRRREGDHVSPRGDFRPDHRTT